MLTFLQMGIGNTGKITESKAVESLRGGVLEAKLTIVDMATGNGERSYRFASGSNPKLRVAGEVADDN